MHLFVSHYLFFSAITLHAHSFVEMQEERTILRGTWKFRETKKERHRQGPGNRTAGSPGKAAAAEVCVRQGLSSLCIH